MDNSNYASYVWLAYKDEAASVLNTYVSKTPISVNTTAVGSFSTLVKDSSTGTASAAAAGTNVVMTYVPMTIWSSNFTYEVTVFNTMAQNFFSLIIVVFSVVLLRKKQRK